jgi:Retroviral aspartyl protease
MKIEELQRISDTVQEQNIISLNVITTSEGHGPKGSAGDQQLRAEDIRANDLPQLFYDCISNKLSANMGMTDNNAETDAWYLAIPLTEKATETTVLVIDMTGSLTYLMLVIRFIQEEFNLVEWLRFENWWRSPQAIPRYKLQEWRERTIEQQSEYQERYRRVQLGIDSDEINDISLRSKQLLHTMHMTIFPNQEPEITCETITVRNSKGQGKGRAGNTGTYLDHILNLERNVSRPKDFQRVVPKAIIAECHINGRAVRALFDSGSLSDFISTTVVDQLGLQAMHLVKPITCQMAATGSRTMITSCVDVHLEYQSINKTWHFDVINLENHDIILRMPFL